MNKGFLRRGISLKFFLVSFGFLGFMLFAHCPKKERQKPPNIILIVVDALRKDHLSAYGYFRETSPFFDELSREGVLFKDVLAQSSFTQISMASLLTGRIPDLRKAYYEDLVLNDEVLTLAEALKAKGYQTGAIQANALLEPRFGFQQGFDWYLELLPKELMRRQMKVDYSADKIVDKALDWLTKINPEKPFFLYLHDMSTHCPYLPPSPYDELYDPDFDHSLPDFTLVYRFLFGLEKIAIPSELEKIYQKRYTQEQLLKHMLNLYDGEIRFFDDQLRRLVLELKESPFWDNTLLVICSDHGEEFLEHGLLMHHKSLYREVTEVPLLFYFPGRLPRGKQIPELVSNLDIYPTILDIAGIKIPQAIDGKSLKTLWEDKTKKEPRISYGYVYYPGRGPVSTDEIEREFASITTSEWRFIRDLKNDRYLLFNRRLDPNDLKNVAEEYPDLVRDFDQKLSQKISESHQPQAQLLLVDSHQGPLSDELKKRLEALGYVVH